MAGDCAGTFDFASCCSATKGNALVHYARSENLYFSSGIALRNRGSVATASKTINLSVVMICQAH